MPLAVLTMKYKAAIPKDTAITHLAISFPLEVSPSLVDSPSTSSLVVPPAPGVGEGDVAAGVGLGLEDGEGLGLESGLGEGLTEGDGVGEASWASVALADISRMLVPAIKLIAALLSFMLIITLDNYFGKCKRANLWI